MKEFEWANSKVLLAYQDFDSTKLLNNTSSLAIVPCQALPTILEKLLIQKLSQSD